MDIEENRRRAEGALVLEVAAALRDLKALVGLEGPAEVILETRAYGSHRVLEDRADELQALAGVGPLSVKSWLAEWPPRCLARRVQDVEVLLLLPESVDTAAARARILAEAESLRPAASAGDPEARVREARLRDLLGMF